MIERERITGYVTPSFSDCYNEHAKQVVENCVERYKIIPHGVHKEKGIKTLCKELDRLLKEVYRCHNRLDRIIGKKHRIIYVVDNVVYTEKYPKCNYIDSDSISFICTHITNRLEAERLTISSNFAIGSDHFKISELACCIVTDLRRIAALLLWLHKYGVIDGDCYVPKDDSMWVSIIYPYLFDDSGNIVYSNACDFTISRAFDRRINYSKIGLSDARYNKYEKENESKIN